MRTLSPSCCCRRLTPVALRSLLPYTMTAGVGFEVVRRHWALALDVCHAGGFKAVCGTREALNNCLGDLDGHRVPVRLHARGDVDRVAEEDVREGGDPHHACASGAAVDAHADAQWPPLAAALHAVCDTGGGLKQLFCARVFP